MKLDRIKMVLILRINMVFDFTDDFFLFLREYNTNNISVNIHTVNEEWLFSLYWCRGVESVATNNCQSLSKLQTPIFHLVSARQSSYTDKSYIFWGQWKMILVLRLSKVVIFFLVCNNCNVEKKGGCNLKNLTQLP